MSDSPAAVTRSDVAIIGAGPVGLFAIFECGMLKMSCQVIDALDAPGGQCVALYPEKPIYDIPGYPTIGATELIDRLGEQAAPFKPVYRLGRQVESLTRAGEDWVLGLSDGSKAQARAVIIAAGVGAFGPNRPPLANLDAYEGKSVHYLVKRREDFRGKRVVIAGGGDSAVDWALSLADVAARVMVVHRRDKFRAAPESARQMKELGDAGKIDIVGLCQGITGSIDMTADELRKIVREELDRTFADAPTGTGRKAMSESVKRQLLTQLKDRLLKRPAKA